MLPGSKPLLAIAATAALLAQSSDDATWRIRREALDQSSLKRTMHFLTDVHGPRLTGSPRFNGAADWVVTQLKAWGLENAHLEPWEFGHPGWDNERTSVHIVSPVRDALVCEVIAWTPGTKGRTRAQVVQIVPPQNPTEEKLTEFLDNARSKVSGKIALVGASTPLPVSFAPLTKRREDSDVVAMYDPTNPNPPTFFNRGPATPARDPKGPKTVSARDVERRINEFLAVNGAVGRVNDGGRDHGQIRAFNNRTFDIAKAVPSIVLRAEDYGRISRILADGTPVELEMEIENKWYPEGKTAHNVIAEIAGSDKKDEVVMLGGHLDSWHSATGATDNAIGSAVMMEALRILKATGAKPRRTVRLALWSGEEQGLLGSKAYVKEHFGTFENPKPEGRGFVAYFNIDSGTGRARGMSAFGPESAAKVLRGFLAQFADLGVLGARASRSRQAGGSDHSSFAEAGFAGISVGQDPIEYGSHTWHTNLDTYERIVFEDAQKSATVIAATVLHLANREERLPRFAKDEIPAVPKAAAASE
ncbi:MAG: M20/M25/M40 family metallo-hydrolase [Acidobacteria bacterium]|nr:M20/M25/M40 family metallo-hydrolase [Acidobacteriota bacterium]